LVISNFDDTGDKLFTGINNTGNILSLVIKPSFRFSLFALHGQLNEGNQIHNFISSYGSGTVINYGSGSDFLTSYGSGSGSTSQNDTVPTVPVPLPQRWIYQT
jgi:hypothetical protein